MEDTTNLLKNVGTSLKFKLQCDYVFERNLEIFHTMILVIIIDIYIKKKNVKS